MVVLFLALEPPRRRPSSESAQVSSKPGEDQGRGGARAHAGPDTEGPAGEALSSADGADRLDRGRGRHSQGDGFGGWRPTGSGRWPGGGSQAGGQDRGQAHRGAGSLARGRPPAACADALGTAALRAGQGGGARADQADRAAARAFGQGDSAAGCGGAAPGVQAKLKAARKLEELADRCEQVTEQIKKRVAGEKITDRLVSLWDPDARSIRKGKLSHSPASSAMSVILPQSSQIGNPAEERRQPPDLGRMGGLQLQRRHLHNLSRKQTTPQPREEGEEPGARQSKR
jgi:hypothetical protein